MVVVVLGLSLQIETVVYTRNYVVISTVGAMPCEKNCMNDPHPAVNQPQCAAFVHAPSNERQILSLT